MRARHTLSFAALALAAVTNLSAQGTRQAPPPPPPAAAVANQVSVTVKYTGKGVVDATHDIVVVLLDNPMVGPTSRPLAMQKVTKSGGVAVFPNVTAAKVYAFAVYDEKGTWDEQTGPPAPGTPMGSYHLAGKTDPAPVTPGPKTAVTLTFDGTKKFGM